MLTLGTGIGSALINDGVLVPNTEFGHLKMGKQQIDAEDLAAESVREREDLGWKEWSKRLSHYLDRPRGPALARPVRAGRRRVEEGRQVRAPPRVPHARSSPPQLLNQAGIVGAALAATRLPPLG